MIRSFAIRLAWREGKASWRRFSVFMGSIALGVGSLVAVHSFRADVQRSLGDQARLLLGADVRVSSNRAFPDEWEVALDSMIGTGRNVARTTTFASMVLDTRSGGIRLLQVRGVDAAFPYYGEVVSTPAGAWTQIQSGPWAVVDPAVLIQLDAVIGDTLTIGESRFVLGGTVTGLPTAVGFQSALGPRVYIARDRLASTGLLAVGSVARYHANFLMPDREDRDDLLNDHHELFERYRLRHTPAEVQARQMSSAVEDLAGYLGLMGLAALFLGGIGVASAIHVYVREKIVTVAVLRCLGARQRSIFAAYLLQAATLAFVGSALGVVIGIGIQFILPVALSELLPIDVTTQVSASAVFAGLSLGVWVALMFALGPLLDVRGVPPLVALRRDFENGQRRNLWKTGSLALLVITVMALTWLEAPTPSQGLGFSLALGVVGIALWISARLLMSCARRFFPRRMSFPVRQGVSNLFRPQNQTVSVILALGFGAFVIGTVGLVEGSLGREFTLDSGQGRPNLLLFDVQSDQRTSVEEFIGSRSSGSPVSTPLVPSRLAAINGTSVEELLDVPREGRPPRWALRREYRHTYRNDLTGSEELVGGSWWDGAPRGDGLARVSLEVDLAESLRVGVGDRITWDFAGVRIETRITSLRSVDWTRFDTNFFAVFEPGTLEEAPQTTVILTRIEGESERAQFQRDLIQRHANISVLDLSLLQQAIDSILARANQAIRFLGAFSTVAGVLVLVGSLATSRYQRMRESALLKTLGASRRLVLHVLTVEYVALGSLATLAGVLLALVAGRLVAVEVFEVPFRLDLVRLGLVWLGITAITVVVGLAGSRGVLRRPPLAVFRDLAG